MLLKEELISCGRPLALRRVTGEVKRSMDVARFHEIVKILPD
jgi:hypothetical protein